MVTNLRNYVGTDNEWLRKPTNEPITSEPMPNQ